MNFKPKSKEELEMNTLLKAGIYHFKVTSAKETVSKSGNDMITLTLSVSDDNGASSTVFDYLLEAVPAKLYTFCVATNMESFYHSGRLTAQDCMNKSAYVELAIKEGNENPNGGKYPDKNEVKRYVAETPYRGSQFVDDAIPF